MPDFDHYHRWLGIPPDERPISKYRLLALGEFEENPEVINAAAERQTMYLRSMQAGEHANLVAQLLNEVSQARVTLLDPAEKSNYDALLSADRTNSIPQQEATHALTPDVLPPVETGVALPNTFSPYMTSQLQRAKTSQKRKQTQHEFVKWTSVTVLVAVAVVSLINVFTTEETTKTPKLSADDYRVINEEGLVGYPKTSVDNRSVVTNNTNSEPVRDSTDTSHANANNETSPAEAAVAPPLADASFDADQEQKSVIIAGAEEQKRIVQDLLQNGVDLEIDIRFTDGSSRRVTKQASGSKPALLPANFEVVAIHHGGRPMLVSTAKQIASLGTVKNLQVWNCGLRREHLQYLVLLPQLEALNLDDNDLAGDDLEGLVIPAYYLYLSSNPRLKLSDILEFQAPRMRLLRHECAISKIEELIQLETQFLQLTELTLTPDKVSLACITNLHKSKRISVLGLRVTEPFFYGADQTRAALWQERTRAIIRSEFFRTRLERLELLDVSEDSVNYVVDLLESLDAAPTSTSLQKLGCYVWGDAVKDKELLDRYEQALSRLTLKYPRLEVQDMVLERSSPSPKDSRF